MSLRLAAAALLLSLSGLMAAQAADWGKPPVIPPPAPPPPPVKVLMETSLGPVVISLNQQRAPLSVANFLAYVGSGYYEGMIFHRVIPGFMAQGGGVDEQFRRRTMRLPVKNEADNGLKNRRGTIALARTSDPHSATSEFFINLADNPKLDANLDNWGYTVFGVVESGMEVIDRMAMIPTGAGGDFSSDVPQTPVVIQKMSLLEVAAEAAPAPDAPASLAPSVVPSP